jgi:hypothetical protein
VVPHRDKGHERRRGATFDSPWSNNTFNGIRLPSIAVRETDGNVRLVWSFDYGDFKSRLS